MKIQRATLKDSKVLYELQQLAYQSESLLYSKNIAPLLENEKDIQKNIEEKIVLVAVDNEELVGSVQAFKKEGTCFIGRVMVHPKHQKKGIGKLLIESIEKEFSNVFYEVYTGNRSEKTINFYLKMGYQLYCAKDNFLYFRK